MKQFTEDSITPIDQHPFAEGTALGHPPLHEIAAKLLSHKERHGDKAEKITELLGQAGIPLVVTKSKDDEGTLYRYDDLPSDHSEQIVSVLSNRAEDAKKTHEYVNKNLEQYKLTLVSGLVSYAERLGIDSSGLEELFAKRLSNIREVQTTDWILDGDSLNFGTGASFGTLYGLLKVDSPSMIKGADIRRTDLNLIIDKEIIHELEHAVSFTGANNRGAITRSGLAVMNTNPAGQLIQGRHGSDLLDEGTQEHILWRQHIGPGVSPSYMNTVMFWDMVIDLDPLIEKLRFEAKFLGTAGSRGELIGHVEDLLGPHAVEIIEKDILPTHKDLKSYPENKDKFIEMLEEEHRERAREVLDKSQLEIFVPMGYGYTDKQLRRMKQTGIVRGIQPAITSL